MLHLQRHDDHPAAPGLSVEREVAGRRERALQEGGRDAGQKLAGLTDAGIIAEGGDVALHARVVQKERPAREAQEVQHRANDALGNLGSVAHGHQLMDLGEVADLDLELGGVDCSLGEVRCETQVGARAGNEGTTCHVQLTLTPRARGIAVAENDARDALTRRGFVIMIVISVDHDDSRHVARLAVLRELQVRTGTLERGQKVTATAVYADCTIHRTGRLYLASGAQRSRQS